MALRTVRKGKPFMTDETRRPARQPSYAERGLISPTQWLDSLEVGGPYDIPKHLNPNSVKVMTHRDTFAASGKKFSARKPSAFKPLQIMRIDDGEAPAVPWVKGAPAPKKTVRKRRGNLAADIMALTIGEGIILDTNEYGVRDAAKEITRSTGRQFAVLDGCGKWPVLKRVG